MPFGASRVIGRPSKLIAPAEGRISPMIVRTVVVLPMPLRPISDTTCPASAARSMPNSTRP